MYFTRKVHLVHGLHVARFLIFFTINILKFQKIPRKILDVDNDLFYSPANFQPEIVCNKAYTKMTNSDKSDIFESGTVHDLRFRNLSFLHRPKYWIFWIVILHTCRNNHCLALGILFTFFRNLKMWFSNFSKNGLHGARAPKRRTPFCCFCCWRGACLCLLVTAWITCLCTFFASLQVILLYSFVVLICSGSLFLFHSV